MAVLRLHALALLAECIADRVPDLKGRICAGPSESPHRLEFPSLSILPVRFRYFPDQAAEHQTIGATTVVMNVGRHEGTVQLRLGAQTHRRRAALEQEILEVFLGDADRPGILVTTVAESHDAIVAWELGRDEWDNEKAFDKKWYSILTLAAQFPALVTVGSVHTIEEIRSTLTEDLTTPIASVASEEKETVSIDEDGCTALAVSP